jgi:23S rRNA (cytosine1962-C5)-methyltransferase
VSEIERIEAAWTRREALHGADDLTVYRLFHGHGDGWPALDIDRYGDALVLRAHADPTTYVEALIETLDRLCTPRHIVLKELWRRDGSPASRGGVVLRGEGGRRVVEERGLRFEVDLTAALNTGLFLDARPVRQRLRTVSAERDVLNCFAYTGSLGVAARAGAARSVTHVDTQGRQLERALRNHQLNDQPIDHRDLVAGDCFRMLAKTRRRFGGIILDPPPRLPGRRASGVDPQNYRKLLGLALPRLTEDGWLTCFFNRRGSTVAADVERVLEVAQALEIDLELDGTQHSGEDFHEPDETQRLRVAWFRRL